MWKRERAGRKKSLFTMIELMIVVIIVAILAASAVPLYRGAVSRAYRAEIGTALGTIRSAQRLHYAEHDTYVTENTSAAKGLLAVSEDDFTDMAYVKGPGWTNWESAFALSDSDGFSVTWSASGAGYTEADPFPGDFSTATINAEGTVTYN